MKIIIPLAFALSGLALSAAGESNKTIPFDQLGAEVEKQGAGDGAAIVPTDGGAKLKSAMQDLEAEATREGLWLTSTADEDAGKPNRFRIRAMAVGRETASVIAATGLVHATAETVVFTRPGLIEEYGVSSDGVRQDFVIPERPSGSGNLGVELEITGAIAAPAAYGAKLTVSATGREIAYSRLQVTDSLGTEQTARMEVTAPDRLRLIVEDADAVYPLRIDPTFSDADWISMGGVGGTNGTVYAVASDGATNLYVAGAFTQIADITVNRIAKWDGSKWSALGTGTNGEIRALAVSGSDLYAGGSFTQAGAAIADRVAKWNGSGWSGVGSGIGGSFPYVSSLAVSGGNLYAGGGFSTAGGVAASNVAKWNGSVWAALGSGTSGSVNSLAVNGSDLYVGGGFFTAGGISVNNVARWNGTAWSAMGEGLGFNIVYALTLQGTTVYALKSSSVGRWDGSSWVDIAIPYTSSGGGGALVVNGSDLYVGGSFSTSTLGNGILKWNGSAWSALGSGIGDAVSVSAMAFHGGVLYVGGSFSKAGGLPASRVAKWNGSAWSAIHVAGPNGVVSEILIDGGDLYIGGTFTEVGGISANRVAKWNGSAWSAFGSGLDSPSVNALALRGGELYAGGDFTTAGGSTVNYLAKWNGTAWTPLGSGMNNAVYDLATDGTDLYACGGFSSAGGIAASCIAKWNGSAWSALGSGLNTYCYALAVNGTDVYVGGSFWTAGGAPAASIAKWNGSAWSPLGTGSSIVVSDLVLSGGDLYATGAFATIRGVGKWDGSSWSALGTGVSSSDSVSALAVGNGELYAGGNFTSIGGTPANRIARWNGTSWSALGSGVDSPFSNDVRALELSGNNLYAGGTFTTAGGKLSLRLAKAIVATGPEITVEEPVGVGLSHAGGKDFGPALLGQTVPLVFTIRNPGTSNLTLSGSPTVSISGTDAALFSVVAQPAATTLAPSGSTTFQINFTPPSSGAKSAALSIASNDDDENPFLLNLSGRGLSFAEDTDGDGLNDGAEWQMKSLGFDWQTAQAGAVATYFASSGNAGLYTQSQLQALKPAAPLISRNPTTGKFKLTMDWKKATNLTNFSDFPAAPAEVSVNGGGDIEFEFASPDPAAFFRIEVE